MKTLADGQIIWEPSKEQIDQTVLTQYVNWLKEKKGLAFHNYHELWKWSVYELENFWASIWDFCEVKAERKYDKVLADNSMPGAKWFEGLETQLCRECIIE